MSLVDKFWASPPVTRTWAAAVFTISILIHATLLSGSSFVYEKSRVLKIFPEIWRLATSCCLTGGIGIIFTPYMIWTYAGWLESESAQFAREPGKFLLYLIFSALTILIINSYFWGSKIFTQPLLIALMYTWSQQNLGRPTNVYFITLDARYLWPAILFIDFLVGGWVAMLQSLAGVVAAHLYNFLTIYWPKYGKGSNLLFTPAFVAASFPPARNSNITRNEEQASSSAKTSGSSTGFSSWNSRGQGRRLGGD